MILGSALLKQRMAEELLVFARKRALDDHHREREIDEISREVARKHKATGTGDGTAGCAGCAGAKVTAGGTVDFFREASRTNLSDAARKASATQYGGQRLSLQGSKVGRSTDVEIVEGDTGGAKNSKKGGRGRGVRNDAAPSKAAPRQAAGEKKRGTTVRGTRSEL